MSSTSTPAPSAWSVFLAGLNGPALVWSIGLAAIGAALLNPVFMIPFSALLGRALFLALVLLLVFNAARAWSAAPLLRWLPAWLAPPLAVVLATPPTVFAIYLFATGGSLESFLRVPERISGFFWIAGSGIVLGLFAVAGAQVRERLAQARAQALEFELERSRLEHQAAEARLTLLQAQIEPHFLFNTLANVQALVESGSPRAADVLKSLIAYLRAAMPRLHDAAPTLDTEVTLVRAYLELMQMRMPDRLAFTVDIAPALRARRFPAMALLTLVENAVRHAIDPSEAGGRIDVGGAPEGRGMRLWVADTGAGMDPRAQAGTGLTNLRDRLAAFFGPGATLQLAEQAPHGLRAEIFVPE